MQNVKLLFATLFGSMALVFGLAWFLSNMTGGPASSANTQQAAKIDPQQLEAGALHVTGATESAKFTLVEFSDFQCPACAAMAPQVKALLKQYPDDLKLVYRHFPLRTIHENAESAARAAVSAQKAGKFWEMHDVLFQTQNQWAKEKDPRIFFAAKAEELGIPKEQFFQGYETAETIQYVSDDLRLAETLKLNSTPTFFLNGEQMGLDQVVKRLEAAK